MQTATAIPNVLPLIKTSKSVASHPGSPNTVGSCDVKCRTSLNPGLNSMLEKEVPSFKKLSGVYKASGWCPEKVQKTDANKIRSALTELVFLFL